MYDEWVEDLNRFVVGTSFDRVTALKSFQRLARSLVSKYEIESEQLDEDLGLDPINYPVDMTGIHLDHFKTLCKSLFVCLKGNPTPNQVRLRVEAIFDGFLGIESDRECELCSHLLKVYLDPEDSGKLSLSCRECGNVPDPYSSSVKRVDNASIEKLGLIPVKPLCQWQELSDYLWDIQEERAVRSDWFDTAGEGEV